MRTAARHSWSLLLLQVEQDRRRNGLGRAGNGLHGCLIHRHLFAVMRFLLMASLVVEDLRTGFGLQDHVDCTVNPLDLAACRGAAVGEWPFAMKLAIL